MTAFLEAVAAEVTAAVPALVPGETLFAGRMPEAPDRAVALFEYEGLDGEYTLGSGGDIRDHPRLQVLCRAPRDDYPTARDDAVAIRDALDVTGVSWSGLAVLRCTPLTTPSGVGFDAVERPIVAVRFELDVVR